MTTNGKNLFFYQTMTPVTAREKGTVNHVNIQGTNTDNTN